MKTDENLKMAFSGESQARNKYTYFAKVARNEKLFYVAKVFEETAENEVQHAKDEFKLMKGIGDTKQNLNEAIAGEHYENSEMYVQFEKDAIAERRMIEAKLFHEIAEVEIKVGDKRSSFNFRVESFNWETTDSKISVSLIQILTFILGIIVMMALLLLE